MFIPFLYPCSHDPTKWTCWCCGWAPYSSNSSPQVASAKSTSHHLKTPTFEWTTCDQYDEFQLFWESTQSWFCLQAIPDEPDDKGVHLEYVLNFLGTTGCKKWNQWSPVSVTTDDNVVTMKSVKSFLDHLASQMDHAVSQWCQIYQMEDVLIKTGETPYKLIDHLRPSPTDATSQQTRKRNRMSNSIFSMPSQTVSWSRNCLPLTSRQQQPRCYKHAGLTQP